MTNKADNKLTQGEMAETPAKDGSENPTAPEDKNTLGISTILTATEAKIIPTMVDVIKAEIDRLEKISTKKRDDLFTIQRRLGLPLCRISALEHVITYNRKKGQEKAAELHEQEMIELKEQVEEIDKKLRDARNELKPIEAELDAKELELERLIEAREEKLL